MNRLLGIDACRGGWFVTIIHGNHWEFDLASSLSEIFADPFSVERAFVDMPVGLAADKPRECDRKAREILRPLRHNSVFTTPVRQAVYAPDYASACTVNEQHTGKKLSKQAWNICPKIREMDSLLCASRELQEKIYESHPEIGFYVLNNDRPLTMAKRTAEGQAQRLSLIKHHWNNAEELFDKAMRQYPRKFLQPDDILDSMVLAVMARASEKCLISLPEAVEFDACNLPMRIVYGKITGPCPQTKA